MSNRTNRSILSRTSGVAVRAGLWRAYHHIKLDPSKYLRKVRRVHGLPIQRWADIRYLGEGALKLPAERIVQSSARIAALEGLGMGLGGFSTLVPDMYILSAITIRMLQKLSLIYGFEYSTPTEMAALWIAAGSAAGLEFTRGFFEKQTVERIVPHVIDRIAVKVGTEVAEKWVGKFVPVLSAGMAGTLNYYFVRGWGRRAQRHFIEKHRANREQSSSNIASFKQSFST